MDRERFRGEQEKTDREQGKAKRETERVLKWEGFEISKGKGLR